MKATRILVAVLACALLFSSCSKMMTDDKPKSEQKKKDQKKEQKKDDKAKEEDPYARDSHGNIIWGGMVDEAMPV